MFPMHLQIKVILFLNPKLKYSKKIRKQPESGDVRDLVEVVTIPISGEIVQSNNSNSMLYRITNYNEI